MTPTVDANQNSNNQEAAGQTGKKIGKLQGHKVVSRKYDEVEKMSRNFHELMKNGYENREEIGRFYSKLSNGFIIQVFQDSIKKLYPNQISQLFQASDLGSVEVINIKNKPYLKVSSSVISISDTKPFIFGFDHNRMPWLLFKTTHEMEPGFAFTTCFMRNTDKSSKVMKGSIWKWGEWRRCASPLAFFSTDIKEKEAYGLYWGDWNFMKYMIKEGKVFDCHLLLDDKKSN